MKVSEHRFQVYLPSTYYQALKKEAGRLNISLAGIVRMALDLYFKKSVTANGARDKDSIHECIGFLPKGGPHDLSVQHDDYLYGE